MGGEPWSRAKASDHGPMDGDFITLSSASSSGVGGQEA